MTPNDLGRIYEKRTSQGQIRLSHFALLGEYTGKGPSQGNRGWPQVNCVQRQTQARVLNTACHITAVGVSKRLEICCNPRTYVGIQEGCIAKCHQLPNQGGMYWCMHAGAAGRSRYSIAVCLHHGELQMKRRLKPGYSTVSRGNPSTVALVSTQIASTSTPPPNHTLGLNHICHYEIPLVHRYLMQNSSIAKHLWQKLSCFHFAL